MIRVSAPGPINGAALAGEIEAVGYSDVRISLSDDVVEVLALAPDGSPLVDVHHDEAAVGAAADEAVAALPAGATEDEIATTRLAATREKRAELVATAIAASNTANAAHIAVIAPIVAAHVPPAPTPPTALEKLQAAGLTVEELRSLVFEDGMTP